MVIGRDARVGNTRVRVIGVVPEYQARTLLAPTPLVMFEPIWQDGINDGDVRFAVRTRGDPAAALPVLTRAISSVDPEVLVTEAMSMRSQIAANFVQIQLGQAVLLASAGLALFLSAMGLYGVIAFLVAQCLDGIFTYVGVATFGNGIEANPLIAALMIFSSVKKNKNRPIKKDGTVNGWLFLPSTVLTVSGSRGLLKNFELRNANFGFSKPAFDFNSEFAIPISQFFPDSQPRSFQDRGSPETLFGFQSVGVILEPFRPQWQTKADPVARMALTKYNPAALSPRAFRRPN